MGKLKPGNDAPSKGTYEIIGPKGGHTGDTVKMPKQGITMPPTPKPNQTFIKK